MLTRFLPGLITLAFALLSLTAIAEERQFLMMGAEDVGRQEAEALARDLLDPEGLPWTGGEAWVDPSKWKEYPAVIIAGRSPQLLDEASSQAIDDYLREGGVLIAVGAALPSMVHAEGVKSSTLFPDWAKGWIGAERWVYPPGLEGYEPDAKVWPWENGLTFQTLVYGTQPYCLMRLSTAEGLLGVKDLAIITVNKVDKGAFIFVGPLLHRLKVMDKVAGIDPQEPGSPSQFHIETMKEALKAILAHAEASRS